MLKTIATLLRGDAARAAENLADLHALPILDQQIREAAAGVEAHRRSLAVAMAHRDAEARRLAVLQAALSDLEARAVAALQGGRPDLAREAADAILAAEADLAAVQEAHDGFRDGVEAMRTAYADAGRRLAALQRGRASAKAAEAVRRLHAAPAQGAAPATLRDAEATLARLRQRQADDGAVESALATLEHDAPASLVARLGAEGFGPRTAPALDDVMLRLRAKAGLPALTHQG